MLLAPTVPKRFTFLFYKVEGLGDPHDIKLKQDAQPYAIFIPRNVLISLRIKLKEKIYNTETAHVISRVS